MSTNNEKMDPMQSSSIEQSPSTGGRSAPAGLSPVTSKPSTSRSPSSCFSRPRPVGPPLLGPDGLLNKLTSTVLESALQAEMTEHLG